MPAYVIVEIKINDPDRYEEYKRLAAPTIKLYGGSYIARGGKSFKLEGAEEPNRVVILQFDSVDKVLAWWNSEEYKDVKKIRYETAESRMIVVEGLDVPL